VSIRGKPPLFKPLFGKNIADDAVFDQHGAMFHGGETGQYGSVMQTNRCHQLQV
jgi:hypothetical protein